MITEAMSGKSISLLLIVVLHRLTIVLMCIVDLFYYNTSVLFSR
jgi:hypothetical protein